MSTILSPGKKYGVARGARAARHYLARGRRLPVGVIFLVLPCCILIAISGFAIRFVPWHRLSAWLGSQAEGDRVTRTISPHQARRAAHIGRSIAIAARLVPCRADCYPQALTAVLLCSVLRVPTATFFGARFDTRSTAQRRLEGHVWVVSGTLCICGGVRSFDNFPSIVCFVRPGRSTQQGCS